MVCGVCDTPKPTCHTGEAHTTACRVRGGVPRGRWESGRAPPLDRVRADVAAAVRGCTLVGHGLANDLRQLGLKHPR